MSSCWLVSIIGSPLPSGQALGPELKDCQRLSPLIAYLQPGRRFAQEARNAQRNRSFLLRLSHFLLTQSCSSMDSPGFRGGSTRGTRVRIVGLFRISFFSPFSGAQGTKTPKNGRRDVDRPYLTRSHAAPSYRSNTRTGRRRPPTSCAPFLC